MRPGARPATLTSATGRLRARNTRASRAVVPRCGGVAASVKPPDYRDGWAPADLASAARNFWEIRVSSTDAYSDTSPNPRGGGSLIG